MKQGKKELKFYESLSLEELELQKFCESLDLPPEELEKSASIYKAIEEFTEALPIGEVKESMPLPKNEFVKIIGMKGYCKIHPHPNMEKDDKGNILYSRFCSFSDEEILVYFDYNKKLSYATGPGITSEFISKFSGLIGESYEDVSELNI